MSDIDMTNEQISLSENKDKALEQCDHLVKDFAERATRNKVRFKRLRFVSIALALATTVLAALAATRKLSELDWFVPLISGLSALSTTFLSQTTTQKMWINSRNTSMSSL
ncbi:MAG: DUF4231 domain-containing protein [Bdellovibrionales bacterium]